MERRQALFGNVKVETTNIRGERVEGKVQGGATEHGRDCYHVDLPDGRYIKHKDEFVVL